MSTYDQDVVAWSQEQAHLLRIGQFSALDIEHLAEEIEDVNYSALKDGACGYTRTLHRRHRAPR